MKSETSYWCRTPSLAIALVLLAAAGCAKPHYDMATTPPTPDPRVGLRAGWMNAGTASWNMRLVSTTPPSSKFINPSSPGEFSLVNSDVGFSGHYAVQGNFSGYQVWDIANPVHPKLLMAYVCPGSQSDISVYRNLMFVSDEAPNGRVDCGTQGVADTVSQERARGIRIFDISDMEHPKPVAVVQTCRGSHTHTLVNDPQDTANIYIYVSGSAPVRSANEMAGCSGLAPDQDPNSELFRIEVIQVPLAHPEQAHLVGKPEILADLAAPARHGEAPEDIAAAARALADAKAKGGFTVMVNGTERVMSPRFVGPLLDSIVKARGGSGAATGADSATLRAALPAIAAQRFNRPRPEGARAGPVQCHDITVYPAIGLAGGACAGYGVLLDIRDAARPKRIGAVADSNFSFWHSATFNNDGTKVLFSDEWGGGLQPRCRVTDKHEWGADAIFSLAHDTMSFQSYYKMPAPQTSFENCVAHNGSLIPVPGRDIMVQAWYQGGVSVFDWTDAAHPKEIAFFDRGPMDSTKLVNGGEWSAYWYNGYIVGSEIARGLDFFELEPSGLLSQNEIDAAKLVHFEYLNVQDQPKVVWPASFIVARAYCDQLARNGGLAPSQLAAARAALTGAEKASGAARKSALTQLAARLTSEMAGAQDQAKVRMLAGAVTALANAQH